MTRRRLSSPEPANRQGPSTPRGLSSSAVTTAPRPAAGRQPGGGSGGRRASSPRRTGHMDRPEAHGAAGAAMPGGQARMSGTPPRRRSKRSSHSCLTACPAPRQPATRRGGWRDAPSARAASLASSAALPRPGEPGAPGPLEAGDPYVNGYGNPYVIPYAQGVRTPAFGGQGHLSSSGPPRGASQPQRPRLTGPPRGSGAAAPQGALRAID
jgi:hypothetical protein